jgi:hypothetical protein
MRIRDGKYSDPVVNILDPQHCKRVLKEGLLYLVMVVLALRDLAGHGLSLGVGPGSLLLLLG